MLMAGGIPVMVSCGLGVFADFGIAGTGGFGCPTVFADFDLLFGLASLDVRRVPKAFTRCLAPYICPLIFGFSNRVSGAGGRMFNA